MFYKDLSPRVFKKKMTEENVVILDVRTPAEVADAAIEGHVAIDFLGGAFQQKAVELDPEKTYYIYCRSGGRSAQACIFMAQNGFKSLYNLDGGMLAWQRTF